MQYLRARLAQFLTQSRIWNRPLSAIPGSVMLLMFAVTAGAQNSASISGTVRDLTGAVIPDARVVLINQVDKSTRTLTSNGAGSFVFAAVQPATYRLRITRDGFEGWEVTGIQVHPNDNVIVPKINLAVGKVTASVVVSAETAGVTLDSGEHSTLISAGEIQRLSTTGRDVGELISILPGFTLNAGTTVQNQGADYEQMGFSSGNLGSYGANGAAPQQGLVSVKADGANVIDPGDMGAQISNVNMDQVQEVKVQTSDFGADQSKGPIVINTVGKSGGSDYHGSLYEYFRNSALNSNDWLSNYLGTPRAESRYNYPGATVGGPVKIPGTTFNQNKRLTFWTGFEYYGQIDNANGTYGPLESFIPNAKMLAGDLSANTLAAPDGLNVPGGGATMTSNCSADYSQTAQYTNIGALCVSPNNLYDQTGAPVTNGQIKNIDPAIAAYTRFYPAANRTPQPVYSGGKVLYATDGFNWVKNVLATHNGFQFHSRVDENISDTLKLYGTYNWEKINDESPMNNIYYTPGGTVPFPTPLDSNGFAHYLTLDLTKIVRSSLTNEVVASGVYFNQPQQFANRALASALNTPWDTAGYTGGILKNGTTQLPRMYTYENPGIPSFSMGYVPPGGWFLKKVSWNVGDNVTWQYRNHSLKFGVYAEKTVNNQVTAASQANGTVEFARWGSCYPNQTAPPNGITPTPPTNGTGSPINAAMDNVLGDLLIGCASAGYNQDSSDPNANLYFTSFEGYATDEWKLTSKLTLTLGIRLSHLGPWTDAHGIGMAVWNPAGVTPHVLYPQTASGQTVVTTSPSTWPGISWHKENSSIPVAGVPTRALFYSPRFGLAYDFYGDGKTVFRGGWGIYFSHDPANNPSGAVSTAIGVQTYSIPGSYDCTLGQLFAASKENILPCGTYATSGGALAPFSVYAVDPKDDQVPTTYNYNFTVDQQGPWGSTIEIAYVGNQSTHLATLGNLQNQNVIPLGAEFGPDPAVNSPNSGQVIPANNIANYSDYRPYPNYQDVWVSNHINWANYNSMQASWNKQRGSLIAGLNYTWSKAMGVRGNFDTGYIGDPVNPHHDYGIVAFDRPQAINATYSWQEGEKVKGNAILKQVANGWEISGITSVQSGPDLAVLNGSTNFGLSGGATYYVTTNTGQTSYNVPMDGDTWLGSHDYSLQPTVACDPRANRETDQYVNGSCFGLPQPGTQGWWNLPDVHGPAYLRWDMSVYKDFKINDRQNMQFRLSGFNFLNHPLSSFANYNLSSLSLIAGDPAGSSYATPQAAISGVKILNTSNFGYTAYKYGQRIVELGFKYNF
jgi:hypothetical protein